MNEVRITPNLNGTSPRELLRQREAVVAAARELLEKMRAGWPHQRDYQLAKEGWVEACKADTAAWMEVAGIVEKLEQKLMNEMIFLMDRIDDDKAMR